MTLGADVQHVLPELRAQAETLMTDTCQIGFDAITGVLNEATGEYEKVFTPVYEGICRFKRGDTQTHPVNAESQQIVEQDNFLSLPIGSSLPVKIDMQFRMVTSLTDPALVGLKGRISGQFSGAYITARRFPIEVTN